MIPTILAAIAIGNVAAQAESPGDYYVLPDTIKHGADLVGLDELEREALKSAADESKEAFEAARENARRAEDAVRAQVIADPLAAEILLPLFDKLLLAENAVKRIELESLVELNRLLTDEQRSELMRLQTDYAKYDQPVKEKVARLKALADSGKIPQDVIDREKANGEAIKADVENGRFAEADAALTEMLARVLEEIDE